MKTRYSMEDGETEKVYWSYGENHSGYIIFPINERDPVEIEWDQDAPDDWEDKAEEIEKGASEFIRRRQKIGVVRLDIGWGVFEQSEDELGPMETHHGTWDNYARAEIEANKIANN